MEIVNWKMCRTCKGMYRLDEMAGTADAGRANLMI